MNTREYKQYDSRWGSLPYPTNNSPVSTDGCGLCAVTHCAIQLDKYKSATPKTFHSFMKQYAVAGNGTRWDGIDAGLKQFIGNAKRFDDMDSFFAEVSKGDRVGVILFRSGYAPDGTLWTTGGHYVAFIDYYRKGSRDFLYTVDSGGRNHTGWHTYQDSMKGRIQLLWTAELPKKGWRKENGSWYFYKDGVTVKNGWAQDSKGKWFWLGADGKMAVSKWVKYKDEWYYLKSDGEMAADEWIKYKNQWYWLESSGKMSASKWIKWKDNWYYLMDNGYMAEETWISWKGAWYWLKKGGIMAASETLEIQGKTYTFDKSGKWIK